MTRVVELRSDTFTLPTESMRKAMAAAEVGDDVWDEDPTIHRLQARAAEMVGKEGSLFVPGGTMATVGALLAHPTQAGGSSSSSTATSFRTKSRVRRWSADSSSVRSTRKAGGYDPTRCGRRS